MNGPEQWITETAQFQPIRTIRERIDTGGPSSSSSSCDRAHGGREKQSIGEKPKMRRKPSTDPPANLHTQPSEGQSSIPDGRPIFGGKDEQHLAKEASKIRRSFEPFLLGKIHSFRDPQRHFDQLCLCTCIVHFSVIVCMRPKLDAESANATNNVRFSGYPALHHVTAPPTAATDPRKAWGRPQQMDGFGTLVRQRKTAIDSWTCAKIWRNVTIPMRVPKNI